MADPSKMSAQLAALSKWIDEGQGTRNPEAITWGRIAKVSEEQGEVIAAFIGATGQNPRKGRTHELSDVVKELFDVAVTALGAVEHLTGDDHESIQLLSEHLGRVCGRVGIVVHD